MFPEWLLKIQIITDEVMLFRAIGARIRIVNKSSGRKEELLLDEGERTET